MNLKLYNTLNRQIQNFEPISDDVVNMYTCGPTVYNFAHIGNLRTYISEDILQKALDYLGYNVKRCMNITDVGHLESDADDGEDKMLKGAKRENKTVWEVAKFYTDAFFDDCQALNIKKPEIIANATDHIQDYIDFIKVLDDKGHTYFAGGNVYFDISTFKDYTKLSKLDLETLQTAVRDDVTQDEHKKNPQDFVLWFTKSKFDNQAMKWDSPWGVGYPGWHIECSVISLKNLGDQLDIHCGGVDHIPVHHTNEIAQTESYTGKPWTKYWWHAEFLIENTGKMSKSKGEFLTISLLKDKGYDPLDYRFYCLGSHYRKQLQFSYDNLDMARAAYQKLKKRTRALIGAGEVDNLSPKAYRLEEKFKASLAEDLNTANALTAVYDVLKSELTDAEKLKLITAFDSVLSLDLLVEKTVAVRSADAAWVEDLIAQRAAAKKEKNYALADEIRNKLLDKCIALKDGPDGTTWSYKG